MVEFVRINPVSPLYGNTLSSYLAPRTKQRRLSRHLSVPQGKAKSPRGVNPVGQPRAARKVEGELLNQPVGTCQDLKSITSFELCRFLKMAKSKGSCGGGHDELRHTVETEA